MLARNQLRQIFALLRFAAVAPDLVDAKIRMRAVRKPYRRRRTGDFLHRHDVRQIAHVRTAIGLLDGNAQKSEVTHLAPQPRGKLVRAIDIGRAWRDLVRSELMDRRAQHVDVFAEREIE